MKLTSDETDAALEVILSDEVVNNVINEARANYNETAVIAKIEPLTKDHPDRVIDKAWRDKVAPWRKDEPFNKPIITYTHTVTVNAQKLSEVLQKQGASAVTQKGVISSSAYPPKNQGA